MSTPMFSVVIPTYNRAAFLRAALESVFSQTCEDYEVIVVDDGSTDATAQLVAGYRDRIVVLKQSNQGPGAARNLALGRARGRYAAFLDSDDLWFPWSLQTYAEIIRDHSEPAFVAGKPFRFCSDGELARVRRGATATEHFPDYLASGAKWRWWGVSSFLVRLDAFCAAGGFTAEPVNGEDADLALKLGAAPGFVQVLSPETFAYRQHAGNIMASLEKTVAGSRLLIAAEQANSYPGGSRRALERWRIATRHIRPVSLECVKQRRFAEAWGLYCASFGWHLRLLRVKYLLAFPLVFLFRSIFPDASGRAKNLP